ncbi:MAG: Prepilin-type N-terminal cleavage/methylation domain-containing protein [Sporanaerobacter sp.]|jgi:prepilin-type N-terminal cleavage/methylation domain-containing protein|uniref:PilW family protein n=1 Tax=Sporanaerobacter sp. TaxID=2010183 RepID=UPI003A0FBC31
MWFLKLIFQNLKEKDKKGFTLIELVAGLAASSILALAFYSVFNYCININLIEEERNDLSLNGRYIIEYMKQEIKTSDEIISTVKFKGLNDKFKNNVGFVLKTLEKKLSDDKYIYKYILYYKDGNSLKRVTAEGPNINAIRFSSFNGVNTIASNVKSIDGTYIDFKNKKIVLNILLSGDMGREMRFNIEIYIRCPVSY